MITSTRRVRAEEKRLIRKVVLTVVGMGGIALFALFFGLPVLARVLVWTTSRPRAAQNQQAESAILFPPVFDPLWEATNSAKITVSGNAQKNTKVVLTVNNELKDPQDVKNDGTFQVRDLQLKEGENEITAITVSDAVKSSPSKTMHVIYKKGEPKLEIAFPGEDEKLSADQQTITIRGETDPGNRVTINDRLAITDQNGKFSSNLRLSEGETTLKFIVSDTAGNKITQERKVHYSP